MGNNRLSLLLAVAILVISGGKPAFSGQNVAAQGTRLCKIYNIETVAPPEAEYAGCQAPYYWNDGGLCVQHAEANNNFAYIVNQDGSLIFGLSWWFGTGSRCGIIGRAAQAKDGWRYNSGAGCVVDIRIYKDNIVFNADPMADCRAECGASALLQNTMIPMSAVEQRKIGMKFFEPEVFFNTPCRSR